MKKFFTLIAAAMMAVCANAQLISFTEAASAGSLNDKEFSNGGLVLKVTDTNKKIAIDANNCLFGTSASDTVRFALRMKTGGKSSSSNMLTLTVPSDGTLKIYARTGSNSATDRNIVVTGQSEVINKILLEEDTVNGTTYHKKTYLPVSATVTAGTYTITYPVSSINIYGIELVTSSTPTPGPTPTPTPEQGETGAYVMNFAELALNTKEKAEAAIENVSNMTISTSDPDTSGDTQALWNNVAGQTASWTFKGFPVSISYKNSGTKNGFCKSGKDYFQFNNTGSNVNITCKVGQYIIITPVSYTKAGSFTITGGVNNADQTDAISIPISSTDPVVVKATDTTVSLKCTGACRWGKLEISDSPTSTAVAAVAADEVAAGKVIKTASYIMKNGKKYNYAGQQMK